MRLLMVAVVITVVVMLFYSSGMEPEADAALKGFYEKTKEAMERGTARGQAVINSQTGLKAGHIPADKDGDGDIDDDDKVASQELQERLQAVAQEAKDKANEKSPKPDIPSRIVGVGSSAEGQAKKGQVKVGGGSDVGDRVKADVTKEETKEEHEAEVEINSILKKSPGKLVAIDSHLWLTLVWLTYTHSHHFLQELLPLFEARQGNSPREIQHHSGALCRGAG